MVLSNPTAGDSFNLGAYTCPGVRGWPPGTPIGRFGAAGLSKLFAINERVRIKLEGSFTNVLNHLNPANPVLAIDNPSVGQITTARRADFAGNRTGQVGARVEF